MRKHCLRCGENRVARYPKDSPVFCAMRCAAEYGVERALDKQWCRRHGWWDARDGGCYDCKREQRAAEA